MTGLRAPWPPELETDETIQYEGSFNQSIWLKQNVGPVMAALVLLSTTLVILGKMDISGIGFLAVLSVLGILIAALIYRRQSWQITDKAVYIRYRTPIPLQAIKKVRGFGGTLRLVQAWGMSTQILGVENAKEIRTRMARGEII